MQRRELLQGLCTAASVVVAPVAFAPARRKARISRVAVLLDGEPVALVDLGPVGLLLERDEGAICETT